jgi:predicted TIM-barrel fold metal-dependent hydrolase
MPIYIPMTKLYLYPPIDEPIRPPMGSGSFYTLMKLVQDNNVAGLCIVQPLSFYRWDNRFICDISKAFPRQTAGVCSLDPDDVASYARLKEYVRDYGVRGLRSFPAADGHLDEAGVQALWKAAGETRTAISVFLTPDRVDELAWMLEKFPNQPVVIDHCLIAEPALDLSNTIDEMLRLSRFPNSYAQLSFLPLGSEEDYPFRDMHEPCKKIIAGYGANRCVWGSNFPCDVWTPKASYAQNLQLFTRELHLGKAEQEAILGRTAHRLWFQSKL